MRKVFVRWLDACSETDNEWTPIENFKGRTVICESLGFLISETKDSVTIAGHLADEDFCGEITIPKGCILSIVDVILWG